MPRAADPNSCRTCLGRKIKCDGAQPICLRCQKQQLFCDRSTILKIKQYEDTEINPLAIETDPRILLNHPDIARLFHVYIKELAPWYDLNDSNNCSFARLAPVAALNNPLLFAAIIAFAGTYTFRKEKFPVTISEIYHGRCLQLLISLAPEDENVSNGVALAATCLLRSYEILSEREDPNRHLFGASTLIPPTPRLQSSGLLAAGFWNYLREDITYSLIHSCPLKIQVGLPIEVPISDDDHANAVTLLLAAAVNSYFDRIPVDLSAALKKWRSKFLAVPFSRSEKGPFPSIRMLKDCHVAAMHYYYVAMCMIEPDTRIASAAEICGLAMSAESDAVAVNAYGPICFSGKWLNDGNQRRTLTSWLKDSQKRTAWPVEMIVSKLQGEWLNS